MGIVKKSRFWAIQMQEREKPNREAYYRHASSSAVCIAI